MTNEQTGFLSSFIDEFEKTLGGDRISPELESRIRSFLHGESQNNALPLKKFFDFGTLLLRGYQKFTNENKPVFRQLLLSFLDSVRSNVILKKISHEKQESAWFELLLQIIKAINFTVGQLFNQRVKKYGNRPLLKSIKDGNLTAFSWNELAEKVNAIARALLAWSTEKKADGPVAILSENRLEMVCLDLACLMTGAVNVLIPVTSLEPQVEYMLKHSGAHLIFVSREQLPKVLACRGRAEKLQHIVLLDSNHAFRDEKIYSLEKFLSVGKGISRERVDEAIERVGIDDLATIMYTSGTTEAPKGIMFSQLNIVSKRFARALALPEIGKQDVFLCYLPLFHTFGRFFEMLGCIFWGSTYVFMESPKVETMIANFQQVQPTVFISIPKKWMQLYEAIQERIDIRSASAAKIREEVQRVTGGRLKWGLSAAGYLDPEIFIFFQSHGVELMSGFGMTEATGGITMTPPFAYRANSVGKALPGIEVQLAEDGEMLIRGPYVMKGYFKAKAEGFEDGWFHTGDIFSKDPDGHYQILDRKKDIYKNIKGETIAPQKIENLFLDFEAVKQVFLVGDHKPYNTLLLYPNYDYAQVEFSKMDEKARREFFGSLVVSVNKFLAPYERIVDFAIIERDFTLEQGELTPKGTFKRQVVEQHFRAIIENLYARDYAALFVNGLELRLPNWLLRENGLTAGDLKWEKGKIIAKPTRNSLPVEFAKNGQRELRVGTFWYKFDNDIVDLGQLVSHPALWLGNIDLERFVGGIIFNRPISRDDAKLPQHLKIQQDALHFMRSIYEELEPLKQESIRNLRGIHLAAFVLATQKERPAQTAIEYLAAIIENESGDLAKLAHSVLMRAAHAQNLDIRKSAFWALIKNESDGGIFQQFLEHDCNILDKEMIARISELDINQVQLRTISNLLPIYAERVEKRTRHARQATLSLLDLLCAYGVMHPIWFKSIRFELVKWSNYETDKEVRAHAEGCWQQLQTNFRLWLGPNHNIAVDPETGQEYRWKDVITFEEGLDARDKEKMYSAIKTQPLIREAIFLFSPGTLISLQDIPHKGVWVSLLDSLHGKSVYRVSVHTRHYGAFDFAINLNKELSDDEMAAEIHWLNRAGATEDSEPLVEDFGGYWPEFDLWSEEFIPGETVEKFIRRLDRHQENEWVERMQLLWPNFAWSGLSAYVDFWNRTGRQFEIADPTPANVIVPSHDYQVGFRIVSISQRKPFEDIPSMILSFREQFIDAVEARYEKLKGRCSWGVAFSAFLEVLGEKEGLKILEDTLLQLESRASDERRLLLRDKLVAYIQHVKATGFLPKRLNFAIQRYRRWFELNPGATPQAQVQTLQELQTTYTLDKLEKRYPGTRVQFFRDTVFAPSQPQLVEKLNEIIRAIKTEPLSDEIFVEKILELYDQLPLTEDEQFFLTRLTYPHLRPQDSAQLVSFSVHGSQKTDLVVFIEDADGNKLSIRQLASPKEIARLHRLFTLARLPVEFKPEHQFLIVLNERQQVMGGLFYLPVDAEQVHLEKIVVDESYRKKGVSDGLLREFFNRLQSQGIKIVTVGFLRPEYFYNFGFRIERGFGNMVKQLERNQV